MKQIMKVLLKFDLDELDFISWFLVLAFFCVSAFFYQGDIQQTFFGACAIIVLMLFVSHSIALILGVLKNHPRMGELTGYITNGPEALVIMVGLFHNKLYFAMGVPLGSNFANPILFTVAALITGMFLMLFKENMIRIGTILLGTMGLAASFFLLPESRDSLLWGWAGIALALSTTFYFMKIDEAVEEEIEDAIPPLYIIPAILFLITAGYFLDPAVSFTAINSRVPEGVISFCILSFITSWPEFRTATSLLKRKKMKAAVLNILISNITNLWLAILGVVIYLLLPH